MKTAAYIQIPRTLSAPADPRATSFLTTLPPELRNYIYEILFEREDPILLHNTEKYFVTLLDEHGEEDGDTLADFGLGIGYGIALLLSCHQVYHEAVGILYNRNTFAFSRARNRHDCISLGHSQIQLCPSWLCGIGSQYALLRNVVIDIDAMCPKSCNFAPSEIDLLPLIRLMWANPEAKCEIAFGHTGRTLDRELHQRQAEDDGVDADIDVEVLNNLLNRLGREDALELRRYDYSTQLLRRINVAIHGAKSFVEYHHTYRSHYNICDKSEIVRPFDVMDKGRIVHFRKPKRESTVLNFPWRASNLIYKLCTSFPEDIIIDLDTQTALGLPLNIFGVNRRMRYASIRQAFSEDCQISMKITTTEASTSFTDFSALIGWLHTGCFSRILGDSASKFKLKIPPSINMIFDLQHHSTLRDLRINIKNLLRLTGGMHPASKLWFTLKCHNEGEKSKNEGVAVLENIQKHAILLLCNVILRWPQRLHDNCPDIWIDGTGRILSASYEDTAQEEVFDYKSRLRENSIDYIGYLQLKKIVGSVVDMAELMDPNRDDANATSLVQLWAYLLHENEACWKWVRQLL